jgi:hypothetical protein
VYEALAFLYSLDLERGGVPAELGPTTSIAVGQRMRAINLATWLELGAQVRALASPEASDGLTSLRARETELEAGAADSLTRLGPLVGAANDASRRFSAASGLDVAAVRRSVYRRDVRDILAGVVEEGIAYLDLLALNDCVVVHLIDTTGVRVHDRLLWGRRDRLETLDARRRAIRRLQVAASLFEATRSWRSLNAEPVYPAASAADADMAQLDSVNARIGAAMIRPLADVIGAGGTYRRIVVLPHRELAHIAFSPLEAELGVVVAVLPSATCASLLRDRPSHSPGARVAFGDVTRTLRYCEAEISSIGAERRPPTTASALISEARGAGILHFAGHGYFDERNPYHSGLVVDDAEGRLKRDPWKLGFGIFTLTDIFATLDLGRCRLAVLSACHTGLSRLHPAAEFTSLPTALLVAGARNVIGSLWPAHDAATALLMKEFYARLQGDASPSEAFASARSRLRSMEQPEIRSVLGMDAVLPAGSRPFDHSIYADAFQFYGTD